jgi:hypothetical protein
MFILRKRTIAPPWAIVRRTLLQSAKPTEEANDCTSWGDRSLPRQAHKGARSPSIQNAKPTEEVNDCTSWGDRSLPRQAHKGARSSPARARINTQVRTFAHPWAIVLPRGRLSPVTYLGHFSPFTHHFYNNVLHLIVSWLEYNIFFRTCVLDTSFGV